MAEISDEAKSEEINLSDRASKIEEDENLIRKKSENIDLCLEDNNPSTQIQEEVMKKKYGGLLPKRPLISKDNERAFFDSADWALGKVGAPKSIGPLEALRPKLQPTRHDQVRSRSAYAPTDDGQLDVSIKSDDSDPGENQDRTLDDNDEGNKVHSPEIHQIIPQN